MDEQILDQTQAQNTPAEDTAASPTPGETQPTTPVTGDSSQDTPDPGQATETTTEQQRPSRGERRIQNLSSRLKEANERLAASRYDEQFGGQSLPWGQAAADPFAAYEAGEMTLDQLKSAVKETSRQEARAAAQQEIRDHRTKETQEQYWTTLQADISAVEAQHPRFREGSPEYDAQAVADISEMYQMAAAANPAAAPRFSDFVGRILSLEQRAVESGRNQSVATLAQQVADGALTPSTDTGGGEKPFEQLSAKEMEARLGFAK